ncbi:ATP-binding protein [Mesorhizobium sp.]|uniref:AAA family ATPase n=1 Tax=Mesorhizobium sp. TaxID=1871066 RepID=UPI000FE6AC7B|nr:ATP-binding protein [Mesorhizobium sp.]RWF99693.1 MAG: ATP-binding protein [Mesorhizobium sp.]TIN35094.1 MAG: ATP-binding protein [Mesorhizobium sp.]TIR88533.1 MAG: ATP-binding protein [Mesorhizobium sp.]
MASAQQLIGLVKSHAEGDGERFFDLAMQLAAAEEQKGHARLAEQLRQWAEAGQQPARPVRAAPTPIAAPRGDLAAFLSASYPTTRLNDLILPEHIEDELSHIVTETRMTQRLEEKGLRPRRRVLLAGPPGTGKTLTAEALAGELKFPLFTVLLHGLITKFMGETAQKLRMIFDSVRTIRGIYLFDEIDALAASRGSENDIGEARRILNSFLQFLDEDTGPSIVVATTNLPEILDRAVLRRFDLVLPYQLPDAEAIEKAMRRRLRGFDVDTVDWEDVVEHAEGLSTADVVAGGEDAARRAVLGNSSEIRTSAVVASLERRRSLHSIGVATHAEGQTALHSQRTFKKRKVQAKRPAHNKASK